MKLANLIAKNKSEFFINVFSYGKAGILGRIFRAIQEFVIRIILPPHVLGSWSLVMVLVNFAGVSDSGVFSAARRKLPMLYSKHEYQEAAQFRSIIFNLNLLTKILIGGGVILFCLLKNGFEASNLKICFSAGLLIILAAIGENYSCFLETAQKYTKLGRALSIYWPVYAILMICGAYFGAVYGLVLANIIALLFQGWLMRASMVEKIRAYYFYWNWSKIKVLLGFAVPFFITDLPINLMYVLDSLFVAKYFSVALLAIYTTGKMIALQAGQIPMWITNVLEIRLTFLSSQKELSSQIVKETFYYMVTYLLIIIPLMIIGLLIAGWFLIINYLPEYKNVAVLLPLFLAALYFMPKMTPLRNFLLIKKQFLVLACANYISLTCMLTGFLIILFLNEIKLEYVAIIYAASFFAHSTLILMNLAKQALGIKYVSLIIFFQIISILVTFFAAHTGYSAIPSAGPIKLLEIIFIATRMVVIISPMILVGLFILFWRHFRGVNLVVVNNESM